MTRDGAKVIWGAALLALVAGCLRDVSLGDHRLPVFPGAEGFGVFTPAGRGGAILTVTTLADAGPGSLREAVGMAGPRTIVFEVSGIIDLAKAISVIEPYVTIAGQTAPSPGIMLRGYSLVIESHDVLVQHLAIRPGDGIEQDAVRVLGQVRPVRRVVIDHVSATWADDETVSTWPSLSGLGVVEDVTFSHLLVAESTSGYKSNFIVGQKSRNVAIIKSLIASGFEDMPEYTSDSTGVVLNSFSSNACYDFINIGAAANGDTPLPVTLSIVGNYFEDGPSANCYRPDPMRAIIVGSTTAQGSQIYVADNLYEAVNPDSAVARYNTPWGSPFVDAPPIWPEGPLTLLPASAVRDYVLRNAGSRPAERDSADTRIIDEARTRTGSLRSTVVAAGGWPVYAENRRSFDLPARPNDDDDQDGYTNLEERLHALAAAVEGRTP